MFFDDDKDLSSAGFRRNGFGTMRPRSGYYCVVVDAHLNEFVF